MDSRERTTKTKATRATIMRTTMTLTLIILHWPTKAVCMLVRTITATPLRLLSIKATEATRSHHQPATIACERFKQTLDSILCDLIYIHF